MKNYLIAIFTISMLSCSGKPQQTKLALEKKDPIQVIKENEKKATEKLYDNYGELVSTIPFNVKTDSKDFEDGIIPWANIENPQQDIPNLIGGEDVVIKQKSIKVIIDYPLKNQYNFVMTSQNGFTRALLLKEISKQYYKIYDEEERTATTKTIPMGKRTTMYNRNETDGKYGIWGHDIADLVLSKISLYKASDGELIAILNIES